MAVWILNIMNQQKGGKSAVLSALLVCFGAKASTTDRGKSVKGLIKEGKEYFFK